MYLSLRCVERDVTCRVCNYCVFRISCSRCYRYCWRLNCWSVKESVRPISRLYYPTLPSSRFLLLIKSKQILWRQKIYIFKVSCLWQMVQISDTCSRNWCKYIALCFDASSCKCLYKNVRNEAVFFSVQEKCTNKNLHRKARPTYKFLEHVVLPLLRLAELPCTLCGIVIRGLLLLSFAGEMFSISY